MMTLVYFGVRKSLGYSLDGISLEYFIGSFAKDIAVDSRPNEVSIDRIKEDVVRFIPDVSVLAIWSRAYFIDLSQKIKFT